MTSGPFTVALDGPAPAPGAARAPAVADFEDLFLARTHAEAA